MSDVASDVGRGPPSEVWTALPAVWRSRSGCEEACTELVDRLNALIGNRQEMVLLEHPFACLRVDEADPRPNVRDVSDLVDVRLEKPHRVELVEQLAQTRERCLRTAHLCEPRRAQVAQPEIVFEERLDALIVSCDDGVQVGTANLRVRHSATLVNDW